MTFIYEIFRSQWAILPQIALSYEPNIRQMLEGKPFADNYTPKAEKLAANFLSPKSQATENITDPRSVGVVELHGVLTKNGGMSSYGTKDLADMVRSASADPDVKGIILHIDSPGGSTSSVSPLIEAIQHAKTQKPVVAFVDDMAASAAYMIATFADEIIVNNMMAEVGSIGVIATLVNDKKAMENQGIEIIRITPPESSYKQKAITEALAGNPEMLIAEQLSPWAKYFQETVKTNRKKLDTTVEGVLEGKMFYAQNAISIGLIDSIGTMETAISRIDTLYQARKIKSLL